jgi:exodeoxyribonuclease V gamma subunit
VRDNSEQPPSVLVSQLRDYLRAGWDMDLSSITTEHALQPFSRRYFEEGGLRTYAREWRAAHGGGDGAEGATDVNAGALPPYELEADFRLKLSELASFVRQPARFFFRRRLGVVFGEAEVIGEDEEPFALDALDRYFLEDSLLDDSGTIEELDEVRATLTTRAERLAREGVLPIGLVGRQWQAQLVEGLVPVRTAWLKLGARFPHAAPKFAVHLEFDAGGEPGGAPVVLEDWIDRLRTDGQQTAWLMQISSKVLDKAGRPRGDKLVAPWLRQLAASAAGSDTDSGTDSGANSGMTGYLVARDAVVKMAPIDPGEARAALANVVALWRRNLDAPLAVACKTALALLAEGDPRTVYDGGFELSGEVETEPCLARLWPDFAALAGSGEWPALALALYGGLADWLAGQVTVTPHAADAVDAADAAEAGGTA